MAASDTDFHFVQASGNFSTPTVLTEPDQVATIEANAPKVSVSGHRLAKSC